MFINKEPLGTILACPPNLRKNTHRNRSLLQVATGILRKQGISPKNPEPRILYASPPLRLKVWGLGLIGFYRPKYYAPNGFRHPKVCYSDLLRGPGDVVSR